MNFRLEQHIYDYVLENNPQLFDEDNLKISVGHIENPLDGLVCMGCGNRGEQRPFEINGGRRTVNVTIDPRGKLRFKLTRTEAERSVEKMLKEDNWGSMALGMRGCFSNSSKEFLRCGVCDQHAVVPGYIAIETCEQRGCAGCHICNDYWSPEMILADCAQCSVVNAFRTQCRVSEPNIDESFNRWCDEAYCGSVFARSLVYGLGINDIIDEIEGKNNEE